MLRDRPFAAAVFATMVAWAQPSLATTISYADAISLLAKDCGQDITRHCRGVSLANDGIQACLQEHQASVSATCTATVASVTASIRQRQEAQASVFKICAGAAARHCKGVVGDANIIHCLAITERIDGAQCNEAIIDAGWR